MKSRADKTRVIRESFTDKTGNHVPESDIPEGINTFVVFGESSNPDFSGPHSHPLLFVFQGTTDEVVKEVLNHPRFFTWGGGGYIQQADIKKPLWKD